MRRRIDESWEETVCMRVFSTLISWSNENNSCMKVDELVDKWEFVREFSWLSFPGQTRTRVAWELIRVDKGEIVWEFSKLSCPGQTTKRVVWELFRTDKRENFCAIKSFLASIQAWRKKPKGWYRVILKHWLFQVNMKTRLFRHYGPQKEKFSLGIQALQILKTGDVLIGAGDGTVALLKSQTYKRIR